MSPSHQYRSLGGQARHTWNQSSRVSKCWIGLTKANRINVSFITLSFLLALAILFPINGYKALDSTTPRRGRYILKANEVIAIISAWNILIKNLCTCWSASIGWKCAIYLMRKEGLSITQFSWMAEKNVPFVCPSRKNWMVLFASLLVLSQHLVGWMPPSFVNWNPSLSFDGKTTIQSGNPSSSFWLYGWYPYRTDVRSGLVSRAAGMVNSAWAASGVTEDGKRCRHIVNNNQIPSDSTVYNATIPCIVIHDISWPTDPPSAIVERVEQDSTLASITNTGWNDDIPGCASPFDPSNTTLKIPANLAFPQNFTVLNMFGVMPDHYPESFSYSGTMTVSIFTTRLYNGPPYMVDPFRMPHMNNNLTFGYTAYKDFVSTYLRVNFTVGVMKPDTSTFVARNVIEGGGQEPQATDIVPGPWVKEALYMVSDTMATVATLNDTPIPTWNNLINYTEKLIQYSYLGSWDALQRSFDPNSTDLEVSLVEPRLEARVDRYYVYIWLGVSSLLIISELIITRETGVEKLGDEGLVGALLIDSSPVWHQCKHCLTSGKKKYSWFKLRRDIGGCTTEDCGSDTVEKGGKDEKKRKMKLKIEEELNLQ